MLSGLVRDVDKAFLSSKISLPVDEQGKIDFEWIEQFVKKQKKDFLNRVILEYAKEFDGKN